MINEELFQLSVDWIESLFYLNKIPFHSTDQGTYAAITSRGSIYCIAFNYENEMHYIYFNTSYDMANNIKTFSSIQIMSKALLASGLNAYEHKWHITNYEEFKTFKEDFKEVFSL